MLIVDAQIHLWEKGTPSPQHRQEPNSAEQAIAAMDQAGVDRAREGRVAEKGGTLPFGMAHRNALVRRERPFDRR
jgi:hypothetical protein